MKVSTDGPVLRTVLVIALFGCDEPSSPDNPESSAKRSCQTAAECVGLFPDLGRLCQGGWCQDCQSSEDCEHDPAYGHGSVCIKGLCTHCKAGEVGCACLAGGLCLEGVGCEEGMCQPCSAGKGRCPCIEEERCDEGLTCLSGICLQGTCVAGTQGCGCGEGGGCEEGLFCHDLLCRSCPGDVIGCPCAENGCESPLVCDTMEKRCRPAASCAELGCGAHRLCEERDTGPQCLDACESGFIWQAPEEICVAVPQANCTAGAPASILSECQAQHRRCVTEGGAHCGPCLATEDDCWLGPATEPEGSCRPAQTCADCERQHRTCQAAEGCADAACGGCLPGYRLEDEECQQNAYVDSCDTCDAQHRRCEHDEIGSYCGDCRAHFSLDDTGDCVAVANCEEDAENSIVADCLLKGRTCAEDAHGAQCGSCLDDSHEEEPVTGVCLPPGTCREKSECPMAAGYYCVQLTVDGPARCAPRLCASGWTWDRFSQQCAACGDLCDPLGHDYPADSVTGEVWPVSDRNGDCFCETRPGFFWDDTESGASVLACDADHDGWVNERVYQITKSAANGTLPDYTEVFNANCEVPQIRRFLLQNDWGQTQEVMVRDLYEGAPDAVSLYESMRNDRDTNAELPDYGGRRFTPQEVNSLTKACVSPTADLNGNEYSDWVEHQRIGAQEPWQQVFNHFSYFTELHTGSYPGGDVYWIREKSRCDDSFPLNYGPADELARDDYWRSCARHRDGGFDRDEPLAYDFALYDCVYDRDGTYLGLGQPCTYAWDDAWQETSTKTYPQPPVDPSLLQATGELSHGACSNVLRPTDDPWRGMTHYSQFRCALVVADGVEIEGHHQVPLARIWTEEAPQGTYHLSSCVLAAEVDAGFSCQPLTAQSDVESKVGQQVVWLSRRYEKDRPYHGGCIKEAERWPHLCPGYIDNPLATHTASQAARFGELFCGCGLYSGGSNCEFPCTKNDLFYEHEGLQPKGYWLCGEVTLGAAQTYDSEGYSLQIWVPSVTQPMSRLCDADGLYCIDF